ALPISGLAREIADVLDVDAHFLADFAADAILDRFPGLHEPGERAVHRAGKSLGAREQQLGAAGDEHHHRRRYARIGDVAAGRAFLRPLAVAIARRRPAAAAEAVRAIPFGDLQ